MLLSILRGLKHLKNQMVVLRFLMRCSEREVVVENHYYSYDIWAQYELETDILEGDLVNKF